MTTCVRTRRERSSFPSRITIHVVVDVVVVGDFDVTGAADMSALHGCGCVSRRELALLGTARIAHLAVGVHGHDDDHVNHARDAS
jgi:hypothetical protein